VTHAELDASLAGGEFEAWRLTDGMGTDNPASNPGTARLTLVIDGGPDVDVEELDLLARQLRDQLLQLDVDDVQPLREGAAPPGSKAVDPAAVGTMVVTLAPTVIPGLIGVLQGWLHGRRAAGVKVTLGRDSIELTNATATQVEQLTRAFLARHRG
jgi:hypothetical protein